MLSVSLFGSGQGSYFIGTVQHLESRRVDLALAMLVVSILSGLLTA